MNLPAEFKEKMQNLLKTEYPLFLAEYERSAWQALRFNTLKKGLSPEQYVKILNELGVREIQRVPWAEDAFYFASSDPVDGTLCRPGKNPYHEIGLYYIQEPSAMSAAGLLDVHPGERILDLCAAPGGKSTQLAAALDGQGHLISNEINLSRAKILSQNIERMGITNAIVTSEDSARLAERFGSYFHRILVDAPCSGEGMFRKNPDAVAEWSPQNVALCAARQAEILDNAAQMLLPGGTLVYSTCTFSPEENEETIWAFLERHPEWGNGNPTLQKTHRLWPHKLHGEGHFTAVLVKAGQLPQSSVCPQSTLYAQDNYIRKSPSQAKHEKQNKKSKVRNQKSAGQGSNPRSTNKQGANQSMDKTQSSLLHEFLASTLSDQMTNWIENGNLILFGDQLYRLPEDTPSLDGLRVLRAGLHIGTFRKNRFEPSHALALAIGPEDVKQALPLSQGEEAARYLRGESLSISEIIAAQAQLSQDSTYCQAAVSQGSVSRKAQAYNGWTLICIGSFSAGWGKVTGDIIKNHYPKGLRKTDFS